MKKRKILKRAAVALALCFSLLVTMTGTGVLAAYRLEDGNDDWDEDPGDMPLEVTYERNVYYDSVSPRGRILIRGLEVTETTQVTDIASSDPAVVKVTSSYRVRSVVSYVGGDDIVYDCSFYIGLKYKKPGKATVSFKVDGKEQSAEILVREWSNPFSKFTIKGVKSGGSSNLKNLFSTGSEASVKIAKNSKGAVITAKRAGDWTIHDIKITEKGGAVRTVVGFMEKEISLGAGTLKKNKKYDVEMRVFNAKTNVDRKCVIHIN